MKIVVTGAGGLVGGGLALALSRRHAVIGLVNRQPAPASVASERLDLVAEDAVTRIIARLGPAAIVHCAALADADACERDPGRARALNQDLPGRLARACAKAGVRIVLLSTDLVLPGDRQRSDEESPPGPLSTYARTKLAGEQAALAEALDAVVLRLALVVGRGHCPRPTASEAVAWALRERRPLRLFHDQYRSPVDVASLADAVEAAAEGRGAGTYHIGGGERLSRYELGCRVADELGYSRETLVAVAAADVPLAAPRPRDASLDSTRAARDLGWTPRPLAAAIRDGRPAPDG